MGAALEKILAVAQVNQYTWVTMQQDTVAGNAWEAIFCILVLF